MCDRVRRGVQDAVQLAQLVGPQAFALVAFIRCLGLGLGCFRRRLGVGLAMGLAALAVAAAMTAAVPTAMAAAVAVAIAPAVTVLGKGGLLEIERGQPDRRYSRDH